MEEQPTSSGRGGGQGRGRDRARGLEPGLGRGRGHESTTETDLGLVCQNVLNTKRALAKMPASVRAEYDARKLAKQAERILLPDAPPRKHARNNSPERVPCRLVEGTPAVPPPPKPQSWKIPRLRTVDFLKEDAPQSPSTSFASVPSMTGGLRISSDEPDQPVLEWLEQLSDAEEEEPPQLTTDYTAEAPAHLLHNIDNNCTDFLQTQDDHADRILTQLLTRERTEQITFDWTNDKDSFLAQRENFVGLSGPTFYLKTTHRPLDIFLKYFDDDVFNLIVSEINRSCDYLRATTFSQHSRLQRLKGTDRSEIGIFLAVLIMQGLLPLPVEQDYFKENGCLTLNNFKTLISYNRFILLKRLLQFTDKINASAADDKMLRKLRPLLNLIKSKFKGLYLPSRDIAIDESLLKWPGRLDFAEKVATKAAKGGIKSYELCESSTGYCWNFFIYTGKGHSDDEQDRQDTDRQGDEPVVPKNLTAHIVLDLVRPLLNRGHTLVMDNFYNSPLLARYLKKNKTDCFGTLRLNREFVPEAIKNINMSMLQPGEMIQSYCRDLTVVLWRDSNVVAMLSTIHAGEMGEKYGQDKYKPQVILDYNVAMRGVDRKNQLLFSHPMERRRDQGDWYKKVHRRLLHVTIINSYIIYKTRHPRTSQREFRTSLANEMIATFKPPQLERPLEHNVREVRVVQEGKLRRPILTGNHFIGTGRSKYLKCVYCKKARTKHICKQCDVSLCLETCFENFHTVEPNAITV